MQDVPPSFQALYRDARGRWTLPVQDVWARHDFCEDLAQQASETARQWAWQLGGGEADILNKLGAGLADSLSAAEVWWVQVRVAELLDWPHPDRPVPG